MSRVFSQLWVLALYFLGVVPIGLLSRLSAVVSPWGDRRARQTSYWEPHEEVSPPARSDCSSRHFYRQIRERNGVLVALLLRLVLLLKDFPPDGTAGVSLARRQRARLSPFIYDQY